MNKKGFSIVYILLAIVVLFVIVQFVFNRYSKTIDASTTSSVSVSVKKSNNSSAKTKNIADAKARTTPAKRGETAIMSQIMRKVSLIAVAQEIYFKKHSHYAKNIKDLEINQGIFTLPGYEVGVDDNKDGWSVWVKKTKEKNNKTFYIGKNSKTKQICCQDIDQGSCEALNLGKVTCESKGWTLDLKK